ncbi:MAG: hypothetical protein P4L85_14125 [Paludisphaera borealis]|uniref:hypothetical protein n=1 Tax=Paludisphaera borealis TaxID=1387353 RepID=UPI00285092B5|nr:hypothetical protein [Paludisphaera borealis]MDR3620484.1 hypothetical protein [Paludisphaera borealis]
MRSTAFRVIRLDISSPCKPLLAICEVTLDVHGKPIAWTNAGIQFREESESGLVEALKAVCAAMDGAILSERALHENGVKFVQAR